MNNVIINSEISSSEVSLFYKVRIVNSKINQNCSIGDLSRITNSALSGYNRIDRSTLIYHTNMGIASYVGSSSVIMHSIIGKFCSISWGTTIGPANHDYGKISTHDFLYNDYYKIKSEKEAAIYDRFKNKTEIGNDVWIGTNSTILNGVKIGNGAVIGANSLITKDVPPYAIVVGSPGKILKYRFEPDIIEQLEELKWWDMPFNLLKDNFMLFDANIETVIKKLKKIKN